MAKPLADVVAGILEIVRTQPPHVYWHGLEQSRRLHAHPDEALTLLSPALADANPAVRRYIARLVRGIDHPRAAHLLLPLLSDPDDDVKLEAAGAVLHQPGWHGRANWPEVEPRAPPARRFHLGRAETSLPRRSLTSGREPARTPPGLDEPTRRALVACLVSVLASKKLYALGRAIDLLELGGSWVHVPLLVARLPEPDWNLRTTIFRAIGRSPDRVALLTSLVSHADAATRAQSCLALSFLKDFQPEAELEEKLVALLDDPDDHVRSMTALCVGRLAITRSEAKLIELASASATNEPKFGVLTALGLLRSERALPVLFAHLAPSSASQSDAIKALVQFGPRPSIEDALLNVLANDAEVTNKKRAADALAEVGSERSVAALQHFLDKHARRLSKRLRKDAFRTLPAVIDRLRRT